MLKIHQEIVLQAKVAGGVPIADALHDLLQRSLNVGVFAVFHPVADQIAENAAEIIVPGIGQEGAGVGEHAHEVAQQAQVGQERI